MLKRSSIVSFVIVLMLAIILSACKSSNNNEQIDASSESEVEIGEEKLTMPYAAWASAEAGVGVMKNVLEDVGYDVELEQVEAGPMFAGIAQGSADISVGTATLPITHADYWEEYKNKIDDIGVSMKEDVTIGLAVPEYMKDINSIEDLKENKNNIGDKLDWKITGIDPGAGQMKITEDEVMPGYDLDKWDLESSSDSAMTAALQGAIDNHEPIVVTLWEPHWAFLEWDLKYLEDPEGLFGSPEDLHAIARKDLEEDSPAAHKVLSQFNWTADEMGEVMTKIHGGMDPEDAGKKWVDNNQDKVNEWTKGVNDTK